MPNVLVMTDTVACIPNKLAEEYHIKIVPAANIAFGDQNYIEGVTISVTEAYELIKKDPDKFLTSAMTPGYFMDEYHKLSKKSSDILHITMAQVLSANFKTANLGADTFRAKSPQTNIRVMDSRTVAGAQGLVVLAAARAAAQGMNLDQVVYVAEQVRKKSGGFMMLDTLRYIYRTGRMSKEEASKAAALNIKPINRVNEEGLVEFVDSVTEREDGFKKLIELIQKEAGTDALHFLISHAAAPEIAREFSELLRQKFNCLSLIISDYSPVMGYGAGPGALFAGFHPELDLFK